MPCSCSANCHAGAAHANLTTPPGRAGPGRAGASANPTGLRSAATAVRKPSAASAQPQWRRPSSAMVGLAGQNAPASRRRSPPASPRWSGRHADAAPHRRSTSSRPGSGRAGFCGGGSRWPCTACGSRLQRDASDTRQDHDIASFQRISHQCPDALVAAWRSPNAGGAHRRDERHTRRGSRRRRAIRPPTISPCAVRAPRIATVSAWITQAEVAGAPLAA